MRLPLLALLVPCSLAPAQKDRYFRLRIVDAATQRGVPLVELETVHKVLWVTDSAGCAAILEPGLMRKRVWFHVRSHGYRLPKDRFGNRGFAVVLEPGGEKTVAIERVNIAERLYRVTGAGIYRDSVLLGDKVPLEAPLLAGGVLGQDSVLNAIYKGRLFWIWGDTDQARYPLGNFASSGATSTLPEKGGLDPAVGVDLHYFTNDEGFARKMCPRKGPGVVWMSGLFVVEENGKEQLLCHFARSAGLGKRYEHGIVRFDDAQGRFELVRSLPLGETRHPIGHPFRVHEAGEDWIYFGDPFPVLRVRARLADVLDPAKYETLAAPTKLVDIETGKPVKVHRGSVAWNEHRSRWIVIAVESGGRSRLGEVWYAEAKKPRGPWSRARRIVTHDRYAFYNVKQHPYFARGKYVYFEGTYTSMFSRARRKTPRYDYNQIMYRLDLDDRRLREP